VIVRWPSHRAWPQPTLLSPLAALLLVAGVCGGFLLPQLPSWQMTLGGLATATLLVWRVPKGRLLSLPCLGIFWMLLHAHAGLESRLAHAREGEDLALTVRVMGLPEPGERQLRFQARVEQAPSAPELQGANVRLAWYAEDAALLPGERWKVTARLKRPRGSLNAGGFDYERYALEQGIAATGYLRDSPAPERLAAASGIDLLRLRLSEALGTQLDAPVVRFLQGLAVGDRRGLGDEDWERLRATGLSHLLAISGLHIGMVAGVGALLARALYWLWPTLGLRLPRPMGMAVAALPFAVGYSALAGFGLPALRSLLMIVVVLVALLVRRALTPSQGLAIATLAVVVVDPLALLGASFWLSFVGVMWLLLCLPASNKDYAGSLLRAQGVLSVGLLPLGVWFFGQASLAGVVANLFAVPLVTLLIVPLTLLATALLPWPLLAAPCLWLAGRLMEILWSVAGWLQAWPLAQVFLPEPSLFALLLAALGVLWLLMPRGLPGKPLAMLLLLPLLCPARERVVAGELVMTVIDVGQGLSVLLQTEHHSLLYDAGPAFSGGLDLGEAAVVPSLRARGLDALDLLVVSHGDNDHAGGAGAVRRALEPPLRLGGEPVRMGDGFACATQANWRWDGVDFAFLHPPLGFPEVGNDSSCVLSLRWAGGHALLPGDINAIIEQRLLREHGARLRADLLLVPHHGSSGSSSAAFVAAVAPRMAIISSGHRNRFGHPREDVLARYREVGSQILGTVENGAISLHLHADGRIEWSGRRASHRRFWHEPGSSLEAAR